MDVSEKSAAAAAAIDSKALFGGSCACARITYDSTSLPMSSVICHCNTCRKLSGGPYQCFFDVKGKQTIFYDHKETLRYEGLPKNSYGGITILLLSKIADRAFCVDCHTPLAMRYHYERDTIWLTLGSVDESTVKDETVRKALQSDVHIFASQAPWWSDVGKDGLTVHQRFGGDFEQQIMGSSEKHG